MISTAGWEKRQVSMQVQLDRRGSTADQCWIELKPVFYPSVGKAPIHCGAQVWCNINSKVDFRKKQGFDGKKTELKRVSNKL